MATSENLLPDGYALIKTEDLSRLRAFAESHGLLTELLALGIEVHRDASLVVETTEVTE